jgi:hypothetical protein
LRFERPGVQTAPGIKVPHADAARAQALWTAIQQGGQATLSILPEDLYSATGGNALLVCDELAPTVSSLALLLDVGGSTGRDDEDLARIRLPVRATGRQQFPTSDGVQAFGLDPAYARLNVPVLKADLWTYERVFASRAASRHVGQGLSPFGTFEINFAALHDDPRLLGNVLGLSFVMEVDYRMDGKQVQGVRVCEE